MNAGRRGPGNVFVSGGNMTNPAGHLYRKILVVAEDADLGAALGKHIEAHGCLVAGPFKRSAPALE
ncbi:MAG TPA: hypothetical protein VIG64_08490, partial [Actinomycetota bacterium]